MKIMGIKNTQKQGGAAPGGTGPTANSIQIPTSINVGVPISGIYTFQTDTGLQESNIPPSVENAYIYAPNGLIEGQTIYFIEEGHRVYNNGVAAPTQFKLYSAANVRQGAEEVAYDGTGTSFLLTTNEAGRYLRLEAIPKQTVGQNLTGETFMTPYTAVVIGTTFNPVNDIAWNAAYVRRALNSYTSTLRWANSKGSFGDASQDGVRNMPTYDAGEEALRFTRSNTENLLFTKGRTAMTVPYEFVITFKIASLANQQNLFGLTSTIQCVINTNGSITVSGASTPAGYIVANTWYTIRIQHNGLSTFIEKNFDGVTTTLASSTASPSTGNARMGSHFNGSNTLDGWIKHFFVKGSALTSGEYTNMKTWLGY